MSGGASQPASGKTWETWWKSVVNMAAGNQPCIHWIFFLHETRVFSI